jgi:hypothetical protein
MELVLTFFCLTVPFALAGLWLWFFMMLALSLIVAVTETIVWLTRGKTLSQMFWAWGKENRMKAWAVAMSLFLGWAALLFHLLKGIY